ncbi:MAG: PQQ-binding-like beta-propeller repeat protein, partial [Myxococcales bacterium]|nr:PQQ-binding-like beta-propeller repeat protein [Myxococcales bacterium]
LHLDAGHRPAHHSDLAALAVACEAATKSDGIGDVEDPGDDLDDRGEALWLRLGARGPRTRQRCLLGLGLIRIARGPLPVALLDRTLGPVLGAFLLEAADSWIRVEAEGLCPTDALARFVDEELEGLRRRASLETRLALALAAVGGHLSSDPAIARYAEAHQLAHEHAGRAGSGEVSGLDPGLLRALVDRGWDAIEDVGVPDLAVALRSADLEPSRFAASLETVLAQRGWSRERIARTLHIPPAQRPALHLLTPPTHLERSHASLACDAEVRAVAFAGDDRIAAVAGSALRVWSRRTGVLRFECRLHSSYVTAAAISRDGRRAVIGHGDGIVLVIDADDGAVLAREGVGSQGVASVAISDDGETVICGTNWGELRRWRPAKGFLVLERGRGAVACAVTPSGRLAGVRWEKGPLVLWDLHEGRSLGMLKGQGVGTSPVLAMTETILCAVGYNGTGVWRLPDKTPAHEGAGPLRCFARALALTDDGEEALLAYDEGLCRFATKDGSILAIHTAHAVSTRACAASSDDEWVLTGGRDRLVRLWSKAALAEVREQPPTLGLLAMVWSRDGGELWSTGGGPRLECRGSGGLAAPRSFDAPTISDMVAIDGDRLFAVTTDGSALMLAMDTGAEIARHEMGKEWVQSCAWDRETDVLVCGGNDARLFLFDGKDRSGQLRPRDSARLLHPIRACTFVTGARVVVADATGELVVVDAVSGREIWRRRSPSNAVYYCVVALGDRSRWVAAAGTSGRIDLWDLEARNVRAALEGHRETVRELVSDGDHLLFSIGEDRSVRIWAHAEGRELARIVLSQRPRRMARFGRRLAVGDDSGNRLIFDIDEDLLTPDGLWSKAAASATIPR